LPEILNMNILVIADVARYEELQQKGWSSHEVHWKKYLDEVVSVQDYQLIIDLVFDDQPQHAAIYAKNPGIPVLASVAKTSLAEVMLNYAFTQGFNIIGCNWLPGFIHLPVTEVSIMDEEQLKVLNLLMEQLGWQYELVADSPGMVTPRIVCMMINEAYLTAQEGTASREDIDTSMRLGTNYPYGPFEWSQKIGVKNVYEVLKAIKAATNDERYTIAAMLEEEYNEL
jgi:3-hydroxybutyryl-CoA dehydrogenase